MNEILLIKDRWNGGKILRTFHRFFIEPKTENEDDRRREFILNIVLVFSLGMVAILDSTVAYYSVIDNHYHGINFWIFSSFLGVFAVLLWLSRAGKFRLAAHGLIVLFITITAYASFTWGANLQQALLGFVLVIAIASILIGTLYSFIVTAIISIITVVLWDLQIRAVIQPHWFWNYPLQHHHAVDFVILFFTITCVLWLSNREIEKTLHRARNSESALREERDSLEQRVEERTRELREVQLEKVANIYRLAKFGKLSSGIFHDLVNPLTAVALTIEDLQMHHVPEAKEAQLKIDQAMKATDRMKNLIAAISKQFQNPVVTGVAFSARKEIEETQALLSYKARIARVTMEQKYTVDTANLKLFGNPLRFHQALTNVIANAIDACEHGPANARRACSISVQKEKTMLQVTIANTGQEIPENIRAKIFDPFFTTKPAGQGNGIGLSITKEIVEKEFAGAIAVRSSPDETVFTLLFSIKNY